MMSSAIKPNDASLLIIDDKLENLRLIADFLAAQGFDLMLSRGGAQALEKTRLALPDLILLDVLMPGMDGFEVCQRLKADPRTADIPVIFMTALHDTSHKIKGLSLGAVDYITKPIQQEELLARIRTHLELHRLQQQLVLQNQALQEKNAELESYAHTIAHSLKTPLAAARRFLEILFKFKADNLAAEQHYLLKQALEALEMTADAVNALLLLSTVAHHQPMALEALDMDALVNQALRQLTDLMARTQGSVRFPQTWPPALGYAPWVGEVWLNYISNALKYSGTPPRLILGGDTDSAGRARFWVRDNGRPLSTDECKSLFIPFTRLHQERDTGHGLGLAIVQRIIDKLGGTVGVNPLPEEGNEFFFILPAARDPSRPAQRNDQ